MRTAFAIAALICTLPFWASAQAGLPAQAGFPNKPLWLSTTNPAAGEELSISTVLYNSTSATIAGNVTFSVDGAAFKTQGVSLAAQSSSVVSAQWTATAGTHSFGAQFKAAGETSAAQQQTSAISITVAPPPPPSELQQNVSKAAEVAGSFASSSAPLVQKIAQAVFARTEAARNAGINYLESKVDKKSPGPTKNSNVAGFASSTSPASSSTLHNIGQTALAGALFVLKSFYLFYPILAFAFLFALWWAARKIRRPRS